MLTESWSPLTYTDGILKDPKDLTEFEMVTIMHHLVILEYIKDNVLLNDQFTTILLERLTNDDKTGYYDKIIDYLIRSHFNPELENIFEKYILNKFRSYFNNENFGQLADFLNDDHFPDDYMNNNKYKTIWITFVGKFIIPKLRNFGDL